MSKTIIDANKSALSLDLKELFQYKDLFYTLAYRDFKVRYAQTFLRAGLGLYSASAYPGGVWFVVWSEDYRSTRVGFPTFCLLLAV